MQMTVPSQISGISLFTSLPFLLTMLNLLLALDSHMNSLNVPALGNSNLHPFSDVER